MDRRETLELIKEWRDHRVKHRCYYIEGPDAGCAQCPGEMTIHEWLENHGTNYAVSTAPVVNDFGEDANGDYPEGEENILNYPDDETPVGQWMERSAQWRQNGPEKPVEAPSVNEQDEDDPFVRLVGLFAETLERIEEKVQRIADAPERSEVVVTVELGETTIEALNQVIDRWRREGVANRRR